MKKKYEVYYRNKKTGIIMNDKKISLSALRKVIPDAQPWVSIEFIPIKNEKKK